MDNNKSIIKTISRSTGILGLLLLMIVTASVSAFAAAPERVKWSAEIEKTGPHAGIIHVKAKMADGYHIYGTTLPKDHGREVGVPTRLTVDSVAGLNLTGTPYPSREASKHFDALLQLELPWWDGEVTFSQKFTTDDNVEGVTITGSVRYMACTVNSCTAPDKYTFLLDFGTPPATPVADQTTESAPEVTGSSHTSQQIDTTSDWWAPVTFENSPDEMPSSWWMILIIGFLGGLLALLTPCVWPMIPMTVSFFLKRSKSRSKSIADAVTYGLSIIVIYLILGIAITLIFGAGSLNELATSAVFNLIFFALLVVFAISFFGAFEIKLPSKWSNKIDSKAESTTGLLSIFFMAFTLVLVSFSCTGPIIGTLLVEAASQGDILGPALGMGGFALGLALPFGLFAFFPSLLKEMPKSGGWLNSVKVVLGFIELILSLKFLSVADLAYGWHILDREVFLSLWIVLFVLLGLYLLGKLRFSHDSESKHTSVLGFFLAVCSLSFAVYLLPGLWGAPLKSVSAFAPPLTTQDFNLYGEGIEEFHDYDEGMRYAEEHNLPVLVDFSGYACVNCRKMEGAVFDTPQIRDIIQNGYVLIKLMVDEKTDLKQPIEVTENGKKIKLETVGEKWAFLQRYKFASATQPFYVILDNDGQPLMPPMSYEENVEKFAKWLNEGAAKYSGLE